jgi:plastocyanin
MGSKAYNPSPVSVATGTTVTWTNNDGIVHTSTSDGSGWSSGILAPGASFAFTFQTAGTFAYHCTVHPSMVGTIVVQ